MPGGPNMPLYRRFMFGRLAEFDVLDTRQYRDDQTASSEAASDPERTILGDEQEQWLWDGFDEGGRSQNYRFGDFSLDVGETVTVRNGSGEDTHSTLYTGFDGAVLNNSNPDTVIIGNDEGVVLDDGFYQSY